MFDEESYQRGFEALDDEFKRGRYYLVPDPTMPAPVNGVIRLQQQQRQDKRNLPKRRNVSSDNLLVVERTPPGKAGHYADRDGYYNNNNNNNNYKNSGGNSNNNNNNMKSSHYHRFRSSDNLHAPFHSPQSSDSNPRSRSDFKNSYEYYRGSGEAPSHPSPSLPFPLQGPPRQKKSARDTSGYVSSNSSDPRWRQDSRHQRRLDIYDNDDQFFDYDRRYSYEDDDDDHYYDYNDYNDNDDGRLYRSLDTEFSDDAGIVRGIRDLGPRPKSVRRIMDEDRAAPSWGSPRGRVGTRSYGSDGRLDSVETVFGGNSSPRYSSSPYNSSYNSYNSGSGGGYRDGMARQIRVERSDSSGTSNMSTKDYWESRWSDDAIGGRPAGRNRSAAASSGPRTRFNSRVVYDGAREAVGKSRDASSYQNASSPASAAKTGVRKAGPGAPEADKEFLSKVQQELELQRRNLTGEIDKLLAPMGTEMEKSRSPSIGSPPAVGGVSSPTLNAEKSSFVDTGGLTPIFKAFVDVSEYPPDCVTVSLDQFGRKIIVEARHSENAKNHVATSFTQRITLPRYADIVSMSAKLNRNGILKVEVPLLYYFPSDHENKSSTSTTSNLGKSYVYEVRTDSRDGSKVMEIVVKPGPDVTLNDLRVEVSGEGQLTVYADKGAKDKRVIKTYSLPEAAILEDISSKMAADGTLTVSVPISGAKIR